MPGEGTVSAHTRERSFFSKTSAEGCLPNPPKMGGGGDMNLPDWGFSKGDSPERGSHKRGSPERGSPERGSPERGSLMLELVLGVIIVAGLTLFTGQILGRYHETKREEASALYLEKLAEAATSYAGSAAFQSAINLGNLGSDDPTLTAFPAVEIATLKTEGYLPPSFPATDAYGGTPRILYREGMVQKTGETEKGYVLNTIALLDHPAAMGRPRAMRILMQIPPQKTKGARRAHFSNDKLYGARGVEIEGAEAASLRGTTTAPTSLALMRSSPMKGRASGTPLDITVPPLDVSAYAAALGTAIETIAKEYENRIKAKLRFDWSVHNTQAQMRLGPQTEPNGVPEWDVPPHTCPEGFTPETALYDKANVGSFRYSDPDMGDEQGGKTTSVANTIKIRLPNGSIQAKTNQKYRGNGDWTIITNPDDTAKIGRRVFSGTTKQKISMERTRGTEGDKLVLPVTSSTLTKGPHGHHNGHSHSHSFRRDQGGGQVTEASWNQARGANACLRHKNSARPTASFSKNLESTSVTGWHDNPIKRPHPRYGHVWVPNWEFYRHFHYASYPRVANRAHECTYVKRNEVTPIRKCNFDKDAYYKKYPMRVKLVPPEEE